MLRPVLDSKKADFLADYDRAAATLDGLIAEQKQGDGYARYDTVSTADIQALSDALTAVSEQVGKIGARWPSSERERLAACPWDRHRGSARVSPSPPPG